MAISRRRALQVTGGLTGIAVSGAIGLELLNRLDRMSTPLKYPFPDTGDGGTLTTTPACEDGHDITRSEIEGPYYTPNTPRRTVLREPTTVGVPLVIEGRVLLPDCRPLVGAVLDVWSCDGTGVYDYEGFKLRGHQFTNSEGAFRIETVKPAGYGNLLVRRAPHVHVKVQGRGTSLLTTQLFFPGEFLNQQDPMFSESLLLRVAKTDAGSLHGTFDFVLADARRTTAETNG
jgi:protocatechuate 3,4-dioxygenase beta subunit